MADKDSLPLCTLSDRRKIQALLGKAIRDVEFSQKEGELAAWTCFHYREKNEVIGTLLGKSAEMASGQKSKMN